MDAGVSLPILESRRTSGDPWALPHPVSTVLLAPWPGARPPAMEAIAEAVFEHAPRVIFVGELPARPDEALWTMVVELPAPIDGRVVVFAEPAPSPGPEVRDEALRACAFVLGVELVLPRNDALAAFGAAVRLLAALVPDAPAILDVASSLWHGRDVVTTHFADSAAEPPEWMLWSVRAVSARFGGGSGGGSGGGPGAATWLRTSGLGRCGLPELEMVEVPPERVPAGVALLQGLAGLMLDAPPPAPGVPWSVGPGIEIVLQPWQVVAGRLDPSTPGSPASRGIGGTPSTPGSSAGALEGVRAIVCEPTTSGPWRWPATALHRLEGGGAAIVRSTRSIDRLRRAARRSWPRCAAAVRRARVAAGGPPALALVQATFERDEAREHRWLAVVECPDDAAIVARSLAPAAAVASGGVEEPIAIDIARVVDWHLRWGDRTFTPDDVAGIEDVGGSGQAT